jgi:hypothetical protein
LLVFSTCKTPKEDDNINDAILFFFPHSCKPTLKEDDDATLCHCCPFHNKKRWITQCTIVVLFATKKKRRK